ncbi:DUF4255 domain-containing protein [Rheinheimera nanhaiensis]|uniref:Pvc16 N-terminal domain-containing protein n=1 Tax=Rheinheimera nanhaiensis E407-8 TaxID=562729 RepID=I1DZL2_9GAMM|nr:DUF4255 domain-containing protein [Rheinheimera nanhaiensis]GAB59490.1 hypothetical protein RNAN_2496 [Rheinheimera nanhaiensis E407-8]
MIAKTLTQLAAQLNRFLRQNFKLDEDIVLVSNLNESDGSACTHINNKLALFLVGIEKEAAIRNKPTLLDSGFSRSANSAPALHLNLYVMLAANFNGANYSDALTLLSASVSFFQRNPVFSRQSLPELDPAIEQLTLDLENLSIQDASNLWGMLSGKYLPSVLYKVRMLSFDGADIYAQSSLLSKPVSDIGSRL